MKANAPAPRRARLRRAAFAAALAACALALSCALPAWANDTPADPAADGGEAHGANTYTLTYGGDGEGFSASSENLFAHFGTPLPGEERTGRVVLENESEHACDFYLYAKQAASANRSDAEAALSLIRLAVSPASGGEALYEGDLRAAEMAGGIYLATIDAGDAAELAFAVEIPAELGNEFALANLSVPWVFAAQEVPGEPSAQQPDSEPETPLLAKTGSFPLAVLVGSLLALALAAAVAAFAARAHTYIVDDGSRRRFPLKRSAHTPQNRRKR